MPAADRSDAFFSNNLLESIPEGSEAEVFQKLLTHGDVAIERILSFGQASPEDAWYDQETHEWVLVLQGSGTLRFTDGHEITLNPGDHHFIPARTRHQVSRTDPDGPTLWLAVHFK